MIVIKGAGDIATGIALRLYRAGMPLIMTDIEKPTAIRRTVSFCGAITHGEYTVEGIRAVFASSAKEAEKIAENGDIPVLADKSAACVSEIKPVAVVDAILAKYNTGTRISDAPIVIAIGPGFTAKADCHAAVETMRGHTLGRMILSGRPIENTGEPGLVGGYTMERLLRAPCAGIFEQTAQIGDSVKKGEAVAFVKNNDGKEAIRAKVGGILRGILTSGTEVFKGMKSGDVDPRCERENCFSASDKALAVGGGVLEAMLYLASEKGLRNELWKMK